MSANLVNATKSSTPAGEGYQCASGTANCLTSLVGCIWSAVNDHPYIATGVAALTAAYVFRKPIYRYAVEPAIRVLRTAKVPLDVVVSTLAITHGCFSMPHNLEASPTNGLVWTAIGIAGLATRAALGKLRTAVEWDNGMPPSLDIESPFQFSITLDRVNHTCTSVGAAFEAQKFTLFDDQFENMTAEELRTFGRDYPGQLLTNWRPAVAGAPVLPGKVLWQKNETNAKLRQLLAYKYGLSYDLRTGIYAPLQGALSIEQQNARQALQSTERMPLRHRNLTGIDGRLVRTILTEIRDQI